MPNPYPLLIRCLLALFLCVSLSSQSHALSVEDIVVSEAKLEANESGWHLRARFNFDFPNTLEDAINKGIALYFTTEFTLSRRRWYWFDERPVSLSRTTRIIYHPLLRKYAVSTGGLQLRFDTLAEALSMVKSIRSWHVADRNQLKPEETYTAAVRLYLDVSQMPKPFQVHAVNAREWTFESGWRYFPLFTPDSNK
ncbi:MAG: DUF4390 domain-containing protein [Ottowia sp.]|nr:DUF4390 domain-containing protein [Ottowia sp.]